MENLALVQYVGRKKEKRVAEESYRNRLEQQQQPQSSHIFKYRLYFSVYEHFPCKYIPWELRRRRRDTKYTQSVGQGTTVHVSHDMLPCPTPLKYPAVPKYEEGCCSIVSQN